MEEVLKKLTESDLLNDETKKELSEAFRTSLAEAIASAKEETKIEVTAQLTEAFVKDKQDLIEAIDTKVHAFLSQHQDEFLESVEDFRDLEVEYAARLTEAKKEHAELVAQDIAQLVEQLDAFTEACLEEEFAELEESIEEVKKHQFGKTIYEAFAREYEKEFFDSNEVMNQLAEAKAELKATKKSLEESTKAVASIQRKTKLDEVLSPLNGLSREIMETILKNTPTERLDETYDKFISKVLHDASSKSEKENASASVLAESEKVKKENTKVVSGDAKKTTVNESVALDESKKASMDRLRKLAGND